jgi:hypothetical protein
LRNSLSNDLINLNFKYYYGYNLVSVPIVDKSDYIIKFKTGHFVYKPQMCQLMAGICNLVPYSPSVCLRESATNGWIKRMSSDAIISAEGKSHFKKINNFVKNDVRRKLKPLPNLHYFERILEIFDEWLPTTSYPLSRQNELRQRLMFLIPDLESWLTSLVNALSGRMDHRARKILSLKEFVKNEFYDFLKHARTINSRSDYYKVLVGPVCKLMEAVVYDLTNPIGKHFIKHVPDHERSHYLQEHVFTEGSVYAASDFKQFENSIGVYCQTNIEMVVYKWLLRNNPRVFKILQCQLLDCNMVSRHFNVRAGCRRMSGEMTTSLGNGLTNLYLFKYCAKLNGYNPDLLRGVVEGDDGLWALPNKQFDTRCMKEMGFQLKLIWHEKFNTASFCGKIFDLENHVVMTDPYYVAASCGWATCYGKVTHERRAMITRCKGESLISQFPNCPIFPALGDMMCRVCGVSVNSAKTWLKRSRDYSSYDKQRMMQALECRPKDAFSVTPSTRVLFAELYGMSVENQLLIEARLRESNGWIHLPTLFMTEPDHQIEQRRANNDLKCMPLGWLTNWSDRVRSYSATVMLPNFVSDLRLSKLPERLSLGPPSFDDVG